MSRDIHIIGAGMAGSEAARQAAKAGCTVAAQEMPTKQLTIERRRISISHPFESMADGYRTPPKNTTR